MSSGSIGGQDLHREVPYVLAPSSPTPVFGYLVFPNEGIKTYSDPRFSINHVEEDCPLPSFLTISYEPLFKVSPGLPGKKPKPWSAVKDKFSSGNTVLVDMVCKCGSRILVGLSLNDRTRPWVDSERIPDHQEVRYRYHRKLAVWAGHVWCESPNFGPLERGSIVPSTTEFWSHNLQGDL
jgi:hypothetical protein